MLSETGQDTGRMMSVDIRSGVVDEVDEVVTVTDGTMLAAVVVDVVLEEMGVLSVETLVLAGVMLAANTCCKPRHRPKIERIIVLELREQLMCIDLLPIYFVNAKHSSFDYISSE